jgi:hypothetical protein
MVERDQWICAAEKLIKKVGTCEFLEHMFDELDASLLATST